MNHNEKIMQWLNQTINGLEANEKKEFIFNSEYAGRRVNIKIKIDAINNTTKESSSIPNKV